MDRYARPKVIRSIKNLLRPAALGLALVALAGACGGGTGEGQPRLMASTAIIADLVRAVAGERWQVDVLIPATADPHTFDPSPAQVRRIGQARAIFANGLGLEGGGLRALEANKAPGTPLVLLGEEVAGGHEGEEEPAPEEAHEHGHGQDPHLWLDPTNAVRYVEIIARRLAELDPAGEQEYRSRAERYRAQLEELDAYVRQQVESVPPERRKLVATHAAFSYLAHRYGLQEVGYLSSNPDAEPSATAVADLLRRIRDEGVPAVFTEPQLEGPDRALARLAQDLGLQVCTLYSDALDERISSYVEMMRFNAQELARCLGERSDGR